MPFFVTLNKRLSIATKCLLLNFSLFLLMRCYFLLSLSFSEKWTVYIFDNFHDVLKFVERLTNEHFMPLRITNVNLLKCITSLKCEESHLDSSL